MAAPAAATVRSLGGLSTAGSFVPVGSTFQGLPLECCLHIINCASLQNPAVVCAVAGTCRELHALCRTAVLPRLEVLSLADVELSSVRATALAKAIRAGSLAGLTHLNLRDASIGDLGCALLGAALGASAAPRQLSRLHLGSNRISDDGLGALALALRGGALPKLVDLWLSHNGFSASGVATLADAFAQGAGASLRTLSLCSNVICDGGASALSTSLEHGALPALVPPTPPPPPRPCCLRPRSSGVARPASSARRQGSRAAG